jgi:uncharacterized phage protein gp47/JayE
VATLAAQIGPDGISAPDYADIFRQLQNGFWSIYGSDADLDADSQDGQLIAIFAQAINDLNQLVIADYNARSPSGAQGAGLSSVVKINGIQREKASNSSTPVTVVGETGTIINDGIVGDRLGLNTQWALPATVTIPDAGTIDVTATCTQPGATTAAPGSLTVILTPTRGWQSVTNANSAAPGAPVEQDAQLRQRQTQSTALPAQTIKEAIYGNIANIAAVSRLEIYENEDDAPDENGITGHSISAVVEGGDAVLIASAIAAKKAPGTGTFGSTSETVLDKKGMPIVIRFYVLALEQIYAVVTIKALPGYVSPTGPLIQKAVAQFLNNLDIGEKCFLNRLYAPANLSGAAALMASRTDPNDPNSGMTQAQLDVLSITYNVVSITIGTAPAPVGTADIAVAFNAAVASAVGNIGLVQT